MRRILSPFAGVRFRSDPVHCDVQRLVSFRTQCSERHARRHEPLADLGYRFHFVDMHRLGPRLDIQEVAHVDRQSRLQFLGVLFPQGIASAVAGRLKHVHGLSFPCMCLARLASFVEPADRQQPRRSAPGQLVKFKHLFLQAGHPDAGYAALHAGKVFGDHCPGQPERLEIQAASVGRDHGDAHLGHYFQQALINGVPVCRDGLLQCPAEQAGRNALGKRVLRQIRVHVGSPATDQNGKVMWIQALRGSDVQSRERPQALTGQPAVNGACRENHRHRNPIGVLPLVSQHKVRRS